MSITFILNGNQVQCKPTENFEYLFDEFINKKEKKEYLFKDKIWILNGQQLSGITKITKINEHIKGNCNLYCQDVQVQPSQIFKATPQPSSPFQPISQPPSSFQPPSPNQPKSQSVFPIFNQNPVIVSNQKQNSNTAKQDNKLGFLDQSRQMIINKPIIKRQQIDDRTGKEYTDLKAIKGYTIQIKDYGKTVTLEKEDGSFKATFLEDNASEQEQDNIILLENDMVKKPEFQMKLAMGQDPSKSTKVLFLQGFRGIAIQWVTGLKTKFQFWLDE